MRNISLIISQNGPAETSILLEIYTYAISLVEPE